MLLKFKPPSPSLTPSSLLLPSKFHSYRPGQASMIRTIADSSTRFFTFSAPPGSGKSPIYMSVSGLKESRTLVLVVTKGLQTQLVNDFAPDPCNAFSIVGHSNYPCAVVNSHSDGDDTDFECREGGEQGGSCGYWRDVYRARESRIVITTYAHWIQLQKSGDPERLGLFKFLVLDEAHKPADSTITDLLSVIVPKRMIEALSLTPPDSSRPSSWLDWARAARHKVADSHRRLRSLSGTQRPKDLARLERFGLELERLARSLERGSKWVIGKEEGFRAKRVRFIPVWPRDFTEEYVYRGIRSVLLCSGTISPSTSGYLGVKGEESTYREMASIFPPESRPLIYVPTVKVDRNMTEGHYKLLVRKVDEVIRAGILYRGLIHTRSYDYLDAILSRSRYGKILHSHGRGERDEAVRRYLDSEPPYVLMSPAVEEGYDFGETGWQIITKVPYADSRDPVIAARLQEDTKYRYYVPSLSIVQMAGRVVRGTGGVEGIGDWGWTFIFDDHWSYFRGYKDLFPAWFRASWVELKSVPKEIERGVRFT